MDQSERPHRREFENGNPSLQAGTGTKPGLPIEERGRPLPGDRGRESAQAPKDRPSFWRRIALGRRKARPDNSHAGDTTQDRQLAPTTSPTPRAVAPKNPDSIERRVVEPLLQALVSVESKLERSHIELIGRSDQVEQRLTQLWDIEEQLGTLSELQDSLLQISEHQRRLESSLVAQTRTLRWLIGTVLFALAAAAFVVAAVVQ